MYTPYLKEFIDLYQTCNYQKTAENMNISSSSISKHISKLEEECGVVLFDRTTRSVVPTEYGTIFFTYAQQIVGLEEKGLQALKTLRHENSGVLMIGYMPVMLEYELVDVLMEFMRRHPEINIKPLVGNRCSELFDTHHCDFVFFDDYSQSDLNVNHILCKEDHLVVLLPLDHPLAGETKISIQQLRGERFVMHGESQESLCRDSLNVCNLCRDAGFEPEVFLTSSHISTIMGLVRKGFGVAVLNRFLCSVPLSSRVAIIELDAAPSFRIYCLHKKRAHMTPTQKLFLSFIREYSQQWPVHEYSKLASSPNTSW